MTCHVRMVTMVIDAKENVVVRMKVIVTLPLVTALVILGLLESFVRTYVPMVRTYFS